MAQRALRVLHFPVHGAQVILLHLAPAQLGIHDAQRLRVLGEDDDAAGEPVDAVAQRGRKALPRLPFPLLVEVRLRIGEQGMHLLALVRMADEPGALIEQHDVGIFVENGQLRADFRVERVLALRRAKPLVLHIELHLLPGGKDGILPPAPAVHLNAAKAKEPRNLPHGRGGQRLLQESGQPASVPRRINCNGLQVRSP